MDDTFPDLGSLSDDELKDLIDRLTEEEEKVSYQRRILHGKIDILRAELVNRLRQKREEGESVISGADVQQLTDILAGKALGEDRGQRTERRAARPSRGAQRRALPRVRIHEQPGRELLPEVRRPPARRGAARATRRRSPTRSARPAS